MVFRDRANPVRAKGDCKQIGRHAASCPITKGHITVRLRGGDDRLADRRDQFVDREGRLLVYGGNGDDRMRGSHSSIAFYGDRGNDRLKGGDGSDTLDGGPGRDRVIGGRNNDRLIDGETDARAAPDVFIGGPSRKVGGDTLDYSSRGRPLRIDLSNNRTSTEDSLRGLEGLTAGRGDDRLIGGDDDNELTGGPGADLLRGGPGRDILSGRTGDDRVFGGPDNDLISGDAGEDRVFGGQGTDSVGGGSGRDALSGGAGPDSVVSSEAFGAEAADTVDCGPGDDVTHPNRADTLNGDCETVDFGATWSAPRLATVPALSADSASFLVTCLFPTSLGCEGTLSLSGPDGTDFGRADFSTGDERTRVPVPLTPAAQEALRPGAKVTVDLASEGRRTPQGDLIGEQVSGGYRVDLRR